MFCEQGQGIIFTFSNAELWGHRGLHLTCGPVESITINSLNTFFKVKGHGVNKYKIIMSYGLVIGLSFLEINF